MQKVFVLLFIATLLVGCTAAPTPNPAENTRPALSDPATPIEVQAGETFNIVLESNPTTGYHWEIMGELNNVEFVSKDYQADEPMLTGSGGIDVWTFKAITSGEAQITLGYYPPYEDPEPPQQTITFDVKVK